MSLEFKIRNNAGEEIVFGTTSLPNRKSKYLYKSNGNTMTCLAKFPNKESEEEFIKIVNFISEIVNA